MIPVSSSDVERAFSLCSQYHNKLSTRLSDKSLEDLTFGTHDLKNLNQTSILPLRQQVKNSKEWIKSMFDDYLLSITIKFIVYHFTLPVKPVIYRYRLPFYITGKIPVIYRPFTDSQNALPVETSAVAAFWRRR